MRDRKRRASQSLRTKTAESRKRLRQAPQTDTITTKLQNYKEEQAIVSGAQEDDELIRYLERNLSITDPKTSNRLVEEVIAKEFGDDQGLADILHRICSSGEDVPTQSSQVEPNSDDGDEIEEAHKDSTLKNRHRNSVQTTTDKSTVWRSRRAGVAKELRPEHIEKAHQIIRRGFNRVSEANLQIIGDGMCKELIAVRDEYQLSLIGHQDSSARAFKFVEQVAEVCAAEAVLVLHTKAALALLGPQVGLLCILAANFHSRILNQYLFTTINEFTKVVKCCCRLSHPPISDSDKSFLKQCINSISLLAYFNVIDIEVIINFCQYIAFTDVELEDLLKLELLASVFRNCAAMIKRDHELHYNDFIAIIQNLIFRFENRKDDDGTAQRRQETFSPPALPLQVQWLKHEIANVSKMHKNPMTEKLAALKGSLKSYTARQPCMLDTRKFLEGCLEGDHTKAMMTSENAEELSSHVDGMATSAQLEDQKLREAAKKAHIRSPFQQDIFIGLAKSNDVIQATTTLLGCIRRAHQVEAVVAVILHCAIEERAYNPFYAAVSNSLCSLPDEGWRKKFLKAFRRGLHLLLNNQLNNIQDANERRLKLKLYIEGVELSFGRDLVIHFLSKLDRVR